ncbi:beta-glucosidase BglX [Dysgonomonas sp. 520]|uniref:beta-glucosidase BglX n=1 Tax=Dysgonomonas sp. 520 TaxID=2302931 RepID=UPI0013D08E05|nr:beta-glucosidase BglX [Dysgonomonas sp. 520]NDW08553.1 beta-glucosidase BglX [Dysgonomonas sp. 520]
MFYKNFILALVSIGLFASCSTTKDPIEEKVEKLLSRMTLEEKIGQMNQLNSEGAFDDLHERIKRGEVGSVLNEVDPKTLNELQKIAVEETRLGIPILFARDIIHGYKTIFPIPLGQAASWNPKLVEEAGRITAIEATSVGIRWTFAPMIDVSCDSRWGRIAESMGEDPFLSGTMGAAMIKGLQGNDLSDPTSLAACAKHFVGYGATEGGRDYNTTHISNEQLRNTYLVPFKAAVDAGCATFMTSFNEINGVPCSGNPFLTKDILRKEWGFDGVLVSDWSSITEMIIHGYCKDSLEATEKGINAGIDMDMMGEAYISGLKKLIEDGKIKESSVDDAVRNILRLKFRLGLFDNPYININRSSPFYEKAFLEKAKKIAAQSVVLLKNENSVLPLTESVKSIAVIGPLADAAHDQMGTWVFDGEKEHSVTPMQALKDRYGDKVKINYVKTLTHSRDANKSGFGDALAAAKASDVILFFAGEESILSGEARCRADISLPGVQSELLSELKKAGKPIVMIIMAGRPVEIYKELPLVNGLLYAWHPGTMGGLAIAELLFGDIVPSGKLPITYPAMVGQIPIYYNHKNTGRPPLDDSPRINDISPEAPQMSLGNRSYYLDAGDKPLFPFGYGLSYTTFEYKNLKISKSEIGKTEFLTVSCTVTNTGKIKATEVVQLYIRDMYASITRPVKELKDFSRICLDAGETKEVSFTLSPEQLSFWNNDNQFVLEPGDFKVWIATNSADGLEGEFKVIS